MSDGDPRYALLDDQRLAWEIPGDLGFEVARRWRLLNDEAERLRRDRDRLVFREVHRVDDGWYVRGVDFGGPLPSREEAIRRLVEHAHAFWDWPAERRRRREEGWPDGPE